MVEESEMMVITMRRWRRRWSGKERKGREGGRAVSEWEGKIQFKRKEGKDMVVKEKRVRNRK